MMKHMRVKKPWEVYRTWNDAFSAIGSCRQTSTADILCGARHGQKLKCEKTDTLTYLPFWGTDFFVDAKLQEKLYSVVTQSRPHVVVDFQHRQFGIGSPQIGCLYSLYWKAMEADGRFAVCGLISRVITFFRDHKDPIAKPHDGNGGKFKCLLHGIVFNDYCPQCQ